MPRPAASPVATTPATVDTTPAAVISDAPAGLRVDQLLTAAEVAELLRVDVYSVRRWTRKGELQAYKVGRTLRISAAAVDTFLSARRAS